VIPNRTGKNFPKYCLQLTLEIRFQHSKIEEQVQHVTPKEHFKESLTMHSNGQKHTRHAEANYSPEQPKPSKHKAETKPRRTGTEKRGP
jgi:hypothetical protein